MQICTNGNSNKPAVSFTWHRLRFFEWDIPQVFPTKGPHHPPNRKPRNYWYLRRWHGSKPRSTDDRGVCLRILTNASLHNRCCLRALSLIRDAIGPSNRDCNLVNAYLPAQIIIPKRRPVNMRALPIFSCSFRSWRSTDVEVTNDRRWVIDQRCIGSAFSSNTVRCNGSCWAYLHSVSIVL